MALIAEARNLISKAQKVVVLTGAGISAESGVATFRDALTGLWRNFDPAQLATPEAYLRDPALVWGWYEWRRQLLLKAQPNAGHLAVARLEQQAPSFTLLTQNVDDLHERAGSQQVAHLHGSIFHPYCFDCGRAYVFTAAPNLTKEQKVEPPHCRFCAGLIRPGVVWFGEEMPVAELNLAYAAVENCDVFLSIGTSGVVYPAAGLVELAAQQGAAVIHLNPESQPIRFAQELSLVGTAGELLPQLVN